MDDSYLTGRIQSMISEMMLKLLNKPAGSAQASKPIWIRAGETESERLSGKPSAGSPVSGQALDLTGKAADFKDLIQKAAQKYGVDPALVSAVIKAESNFNPKAVSSCGALGLMQLMPGTAAGLGVKDALDPAQNIDGGVKFLHRLLTRFDNNVSLALAAYNAGPGAVDRYGGIPPYRETQTYVSRVLGYFKQYAGTISTNQWSA
jgi:soluble lytic murein transglycosylase-like protein